MVKLKPSAKRERWSQTQILRDLFIGIGECFVSLCFRNIFPKCHEEIPGCTADDERRHHPSAFFVGWTLSKCLLASKVTGELAILGLLSFRTATLTARRQTDTVPWSLPGAKPWHESILYDLMYLMLVVQKPCLTLSCKSELGSEVIVTASGLRNILKPSEAASKHLQKLTQEKLSQIDRGTWLSSFSSSSCSLHVITTALLLLRFLRSFAQGFPLLSLPIGASHDAIVRTIALHSASRTWLTWTTIQSSFCMMTFWKPESKMQCLN